MVTLVTGINAGDVLRSVFDVIGFVVVFDVEGPYASWGLSENKLKLSGDKEITWAPSVFFIVLSIEEFPVS